MGNKPNRLSYIGLGGVSSTLLETHELKAMRRLGIDLCYMNVTLDVLRYLFGSEEYQATQPGEQQKLVIISLNIRLT